MILGVLPFVKRIGAGGSAETGEGMKYLTAWVRRRDGKTALLLQQYLCREIPACFACLCTCGGEDGERAGRYITGQLLAWCHRFPWHKAALRPDKWLKRAERELEAQIRLSGEKLRGEGLPVRTDRVSWRVFAGVGEEVLTIGNGQEFLLLGMSLGKGTVTRLKGSFRGRMEAGAGILLTTDDFFGSGDEKALSEALLLSGLQTEEQVRRHLKELADNTGGAGGEAAAILLVTKGGEDIYGRYV